MDGDASFNNGIYVNNVLTVSGGIVPTSALTYDIGSAEFPFRDLYFSTGSINFIGSDGNKTKLSINNGAVQTETTDSAGASIGLAVTPVNVINQQVVIKRIFPSLKRISMYLVTCKLAKN